MAHDASGQRHPDHSPSGTVKQIWTTASPEQGRMVAALRSEYRGTHSDPDATTLARLLPHLADESAANSSELSTALRRALGLLPDAAYAAVAFPKLADPATPDRFLREYYEDLNKRPDPIKLRALFVIAGIDSHPLGADARTELQRILNTDFQNDWSRLEQAVSQELAHQARGRRPDNCRTH